MGLALSGVLPVSGRLAGVGQGLAARGGLRRARSSPARWPRSRPPRAPRPSWATAVGFARDPAAGARRSLVFEALGLGLALPVPRAQPGPGVAPVPAAARARGWSASSRCSRSRSTRSVAWLVWVLSQQAGPTGVAVVLAGLLLIGFAAWLWSAGAREPAVAPAPRPGAPLAGRGGRGGDARARAVPWPATTSPGGRVGRRGAGSRSPRDAWRSCAPRARRCS